ncbi:MAG: hypothetical protein ABSF77_06960 [Spirochaetia bacterium]|jgi:hypothetical protein
MAVPKGSSIFGAACMTADPTPLLSTGSAPSAPAAAAASAKPMPAPTTAVQAAAYPKPDPTLVAVPANMPAATSAKPRAAVTFAPARAANRLEETAPIMRPPIMGRSRRPAPIESLPRIATEYCGRVKRRPDMAKILNIARIVPQVN